MLKRTPVFVFIFLFISGIQSHGQTAPSLYNFQEDASFSVQRSSSDVLLQISPNLQQTSSDFPSHRVGGLGISLAHGMGSGRFGIKSNLLYDATLTINLGLEFLISPRMTFDFPVNYNGWTFSDNKKFKHVLVQPEFRYWLCDPFQKHFVGFHGHYGYYNIGGIDAPFGFFPTLESNRYQGWLAGVGVSYGYALYLGPRWNMEFTVGFGYTYLHYKKYECVECGEYRGKFDKHYVGPTKIGLSLVYLIK